MPILQGLPDTGNKKFTIKEFAKSESALIRLLKRDKFSTAANDNGSINLWVDNNGFFRAERDFYCSARSEAKTKKMSELKAWIKDNFKKIL